MAKKGRPPLSLAATRTGTRGLSPCARPPEQRQAIPRRSSRQGSALDTSPSGAAAALASRREISQLAAVRAGIKCVVAGHDLIPSTPGVRRQLGIPAHVLEATETDQPELVVLPTASSDVDEGLGLSRLPAG